MNITEKTLEGIPVTPSKWIFTSLAIMFKTFVIFKVFKRYQRNLDLIHLLQLNVLVDLTLLSICNSVLKTYGFERVMTENAAKIFSVLTNFLSHFTRLSSFCSISLLHYDRYKHLQLKSMYKSKNNSQTTLDKIVSFKIICFFICGLGFYLDYESMENRCEEKNGKMIVSVIQKNNIIWNIVPYIISVCFNANVLQYALKEKMRQEKQTLTVKINTISANVTSSRMYPMNVLDDVNHQSDENNIHFFKREEIQSTEPTQTIDRNYQSGEMTPSSAMRMMRNNDHANIPQNVAHQNLFKIVRKTSSDHMFYRVPIEVQVVKTSWLPFISLDILNKIVKEYKQTMCLALLHLNSIIFQTYVYFMLEDTCFNTVDTVWMFFSAIFTFFLVNLYFLLILFNI